MTKVNWKGSSTSSRSLRHAHPELKGLFTRKRNETILGQLTRASMERWWLSQRRPAGGLDPAKTGLGGEMTHW